MGWLIGLIFSLFMTIGGVFACLNEPDKVEMCIVLLIFVALDILFMTKYRNTKNGVAEQRKIKKDERKREKEKNREVWKRTVSAAHQSGLPLAQDTICTIICEPDYYKISGGGNEFVLSKEKITDISIKTDTEIREQYVSSMGKAVAGGMVFGALGAIVGGRTKKKTSTTNTHYLIFTYLSNDEICYASFEVAAPYLRKVRIWKKEMIERGVAKTDTIEL